MVKPRERVHPNLEAVHSLDVDVGAGLLTGSIVCVSSGSF